MARLPLAAFLLLGISKRLKQWAIVCFPVTSLGRKLTSHIDLTMHHTIEERYVFPALAKFMPKFGNNEDGEHIASHRGIHEGTVVQISLFAATCWLLLIQALKLSTSWFPSGKRPRQRILQWRWRLVSTAFERYYSITLTKRYVLWTGWLDSLIIYSVPGCRPSRGRFEKVHDLGRRGGLTRLEQHWRFGRVTK